MAKRRRGAGDGPRRAVERPQEGHPRQQQHLYLILDDDPFGCSIREISLSPPTSCQTRSSTSGKGDVLPLPPPIICLEARRGLPLTFSAIGTRIVITQCLNPFGGGDLLMPIYDVRRRGVTFGPAKDAFDCPIYIPIGNELFALDSKSPTGSRSSP